MSFQAAPKLVEVDGERRLLPVLGQLEEQTGQLPAQITVDGGRDLTKQGQAANAIGRQRTGQCMTTSH